MPNDEKKNSRGIVVWITGLPGSGKSTIADGIKGYFPDFVILRMDELRKVVTPEPSYSDSERDMVYRSIVYMAKTLSGLNHNVIIDATGNMRKWRDFARQIIPDFSEIYLKCDISVCAEREKVRADTRGAPKGVYKKGRSGWPVPGMNAPYEEPLNPELLIETDMLSPKAAILKVVEFIKSKGRE